MVIELLAKSDFHELGQRSAVPFWNGSFGESFAMNIKWCKPATIPNDIFQQLHALRRRKELAWHGFCGMCVVLFVIELLRERKLILL